MVVLGGGAVSYERGTPVRSQVGGGYDWLLTVPPIRRAGAHPFFDTIEYQKLVRAW